MDFQLKKSTYLRRILTHTPLQLAYIVIVKNLKFNDEFKKNENYRGEYLDLLRNAETVAVSYYRLGMYNLFSDLLNILSNTNIGLWGTPRRRLLSQFSRDEAVALAKRYPEIGADLIYQATITRDMDIVMELHAAGVPFVKVGYNELFNTSDIYYPFLSNIYKKHNRYDDGYIHIHGEKDITQPTLKLSYEYSEHSGMLHRISSVYDKETCEFMEFLTSNNLLIYNEDTYESGCGGFEGVANRYSQLEPWDSSEFVHHALKAISEPFGDPVYAGVSSTCDHDAFIYFAPGDFDV
jgi:hypothetical protein